MKRLTVLFLFSTNLFWHSPGKGATGQESARLVENFEIAFEKLFPGKSPNEDTTEKPLLPMSVIARLGSYTRLKARIVKVEDNFFTRVNNSLYFQLPQTGGFCKQDMEEFEKLFIVYTLCIRDDYILMDYALYLPKKDLSQTSIPTTNNPIIEE